LIVNGAVGEEPGNTAELLAIAEDRFSESAAVSHLDLCGDPPLERILEAVAQAEALLFGTGTYWDFWAPASALPRMTAHTETVPYWVGKAPGVIVAAHAAGRKSVLSRLIGVLKFWEC
jgi:hypothetical protein